MVGVRGGPCETVLLLRGLYFHSLVVELRKIATLGDGQGVRLVPKGRLVCMS